MKVRLVYSAIEISYDHVQSEKGNGEGGMERGGRGGRLARGAWQ